MIPKSMTTPRPSDLLRLVSGSAADCLWVTPDCERDPASVLCVSKWPNSAETCPNDALSPPQDFPPSLWSRWPPSSLVSCLRPDLASVLGLCSLLGGAGVRYVSVTSRTNSNSTFISCLFCINYLHIISSAAVINVQQANYINKRLTSVLQ